MNYHAYSYDIAHVEHDSRVRSRELRRVVHGDPRYRHQRRKRSSPDHSSNATSP